MKNPNNVMIRTSKATDEELNDFNAWCEVCGAKNVYGEMLHDFENDIICCNTEGCWTTRLDNTQEEEMKEFTMEGFNHISAEGVMEFWQLLQQQGTIDLLWDMQPKTKINALMQSANFDMDAHIKTNYCDHDSIVYNYDDICADMLDEMLETIITLEYCFIYDVYNIDFKGRSFKNLDSIPESTVWSPNVYLPLTGDRMFTDRAEMEKFVMDYFTMETTDYNLIVTVHAVPAEDSDYDVEQHIPFHITGACEFNLLMDFCNIFEGEFYNTTFTCNK
jgi:hypothetical protein